MVVMLRNILIKTLLLIRFSKTISHPSNRLNTVCIQFTAKIHDMDIDRFVVAREIVAPHQIEQLIPRKHPPFVFHQQMEQVKFQLCQRNVLTGYRDAQRHWIKLNAAMTEQRVLIFTLFFSGTAKERSHPFKHQLD